MGFNFPVLLLVGGILREKETKIRESMKKNCNRDVYENIENEIQKFI